MDNHQQQQQLQHQQYQQQFQQPQQQLYPGEQIVHPAAAQTGQNTTNVTAVSSSNITQSATSSLHSQQFAACRCFQIGC